MCKHLIVCSPTPGRGGRGFGASTGGKSSQKEGQNNICLGFGGSLGEDLCGTLCVVVEAARIDNVQEVARGLERDVLDAELPVVGSEAGGGFGRARERVKNADEVFEGHYVELVLKLSAEFWMERLWGI